MSRKPFSLLIKPASADCNLHCSYCFYLDRRKLYPEVKKHRMSDEVLDRMISSYMQTSQPTHSFGWQGGEPTLMGERFFKKVTELQERHGRRGAVVGNGLQTNATIITDTLASHLGKYKFLAGVSLDGLESIHNRYRRTVDGRGSHAAVLAGIDLLKKHKVEYNILVLVSTSNVGVPREVYRYLLDMGECYHQYIPCVEFDAEGQLLPYTITGEQWGHFLCGIFSEWIKKDTERVSVRLFDSILTMLVDGYANVCSMGTNCCQYFVVEHNGDVYPCDFFVEKKLILGNIMENSWDEFLASPTYLEFGERKSDWSPQCRDCPWVGFCAGDCPKQRFYGVEDPHQLSHLCQGWKMFYQKTLPEFKRLAREIKERRARTAYPSLTPTPIKVQGRNEPCLCGSGKKYKYCHGK